MKVRDKLMELSCNTARKQGELEERRRNRGREGRERIESGWIPQMRNGLLNVIEVWKEIHVPETINRQHWKILGEKNCHSQVKNPN